MFYNGKNSPISLMLCGVYLNRDTHTNSRSHALVFTPSKAGFSALMYLVELEGHRELCGKQKPRCTWSVATISLLIAVLNTLFTCFEAKKNGVVFGPKLPFLKPSLATSHTRPSH